MNSLGSWIDQEALVGLAQELSPDASAGLPWFAEAEAPVTRLMAEDFRLPDHFANAPFPGPAPATPPAEREKVRSFLDTIRHKAERSGLIPRDSAESNFQPAATGPPPLIPVAVTPAAEVPPTWDAASGIPPRRHVPHFEVPLGPLATRLRALTDWIRRQIDAGDIFIIDDQGCPISDQEAAGEIVAGTILLAEASRRAAPHLPSAAEGAIYLDLQDERRLCVIDTATRLGTFTLGLIVPDALAPRAADRLRRALRRTVEAENKTLSLPPRERW